MLPIAQVCCSYLDGKGIKYKVLGEEEGHTLVKIVYSVLVSPDMPVPFEFFLNFYPDEESVFIRCPFVGSEERQSAAILFANEQNKINRFARFVYYSEHQALALEADVALERSSTGRTLHKILDHMVDICESAFPEWAKW